MIPTYYFDGIVQAQFIAEATYDCCLNHGLLAEARKHFIPVDSFELAVNEASAISEPSKTVTIN